MTFTKLLALFVLMSTQGLASRLWTMTIEAVQYEESYVPIAITGFLDVIAILIYYAAWFYIWNALSQDT